MGSPAITGKVDWLALERGIRDELRAYKDGDSTAEMALYLIDGLLGEATGRGFVLEATDHPDAT